MIVMTEAVISAVRPWNGPDALSGSVCDLPFPSAQEAEVCLCCTLCADACDRCDGHGNLAQRGRPKVTVDTGRLKELLQLKLKNREMCAALGVSKGTLARILKEHKEENE